MSVEREKLLRPDQSLEEAPNQSRAVEEEHEDPGVAERQSRLWSDADGATKTASKKSEPTEKVVGTLWAKDDKGKDLPPSIEDVSQGGVGDCYLFAAMAAIVHADPKLIKSMIKDHGNGTYTVTFQGTGFFSPDEQTITADFVVGKHGDVAGRNAIWPLIIEKAYAQQKGGINKLDKGGDAGDAVEDLVDLDATEFNPRDKKPSWVLGKLAKAHQAGKPTTIGTLAKKDAPKEKQLIMRTKAIHHNHYYAVTEVDDKGQRVKLFNPWGHDHPNGDGWVDINDITTYFDDANING